MAFCSNCGNQLEGNERFCSKCGNDLSAKAAIPAAATVAAANGGFSHGIGSTPTQPIYPMGAMPGAYAAPGQIPIAPGPMPVPPGGISLAVAMPAAAPAKKGVRFGTLVIVAALAAGGYYYYTHYYVKEHAAASAQTQKGAGAALGKQQTFDAHWQNVNGFIQVSNGKWTNNSNVEVQSATLECDQYDAGGNDLDQMRTTLNGPVQPGATDTFNPFSMGAVANNLNRVTCTITYAKPAGQ